MIVSHGDGATMRQTGANRDRRFWGGEERINISHPAFDVTKHKSLQDEERERGKKDMGKFGKTAESAESIFSGLGTP